MPALCAFQVAPPLVVVRTVPALVAAQPRLALGKLTLMKSAVVPDFCACQPVAMKLAELVAVPPGVVTAILPLLRPLGTVVVICVALLTVKLALYAVEVPSRRRRIRAGQVTGGAHGGRGRG